MHFIEHTYAKKTTTSELMDFIQYTYAETLSAN